MADPPSSGANVQLLDEFNKVVKIVKTDHMEIKCLRDQLMELNLLLESKSKKLVQVNNDCHEYHRQVKVKYQETAEMVKALREENHKLEEKYQETAEMDKALREEIHKLKEQVDFLKSQIQAAEVTGGSPKQEIATGGLKRMDAEKYKGQRAEQSTTEHKQVKSQLIEEQERTTELAKKLQESNEREEALEATLDKALGDLSLVKAIKLNAVLKVQEKFAKSARDLELHRRQSLQLCEKNSFGERLLVEVETKIRNTRAYIRHSTDLQALKGPKPEQQSQQTMTRECSEAHMMIAVYLCRMDNLRGEIAWTKEQLEASEQKVKRAEDFHQVLKIQLECHQQIAGEFGLADMQHLSRQHRSIGSTVPYECPSLSDFYDDITLGELCQNNEGEIQQLQCFVCDEYFTDLTARDVHFAEHFL